MGRGHPDHRSGSHSSGHLTFSLDGDGLMPSLFCFPHHVWDSVPPTNLGKEKLERWKPEKLFKEPIGFDRTGVHHHHARLPRICG